ncbi:piggyBac transposable element-derived protein 4-like [Anoplophora glabripennis]|uniref:piggyBac transposable element-derived protein 4-like n=1 Tax=Anoplophora glabripennis TaxID=217634 RepID=UPI000C75A0F3|nr:piggyBac transposable element-derived protein 4-like [Anoplophora glabripennis]
MPNKPIKWGYKVWTRADVHGYIDEFQIYTGKVNETAEKELGPRVITDLTRSLVGKHYFVYFDNYFTSLVLLRQLQKENIHATGTIRKKRKGIPDDFKTDKELKRGDFDWRVTDDGISCVKWMDKRIVLLGSNYENPSDTDHVVRRKKNGETENVPCPKVLKNYNQNMGFVDKADMLKKTYQIDRMSKKWWPRIFWHFIDVSVVNAFIIFQQRCGNNRGMNLKAFRLAVVTGLVGAGKETVKKGRASLEQKNVNNYKPTVPLEKRWDQSLHMPVYGNYRRCALCSNRDHQRRSKWACDTCGVALCLFDKKDCFQRFHKK